MGSQSDGRTSGRELIELSTGWTVGRAVGQVFGRSDNTAAAKGMVSRSASSIPASDGNSLEARARHLQTSLVTSIPHLSSWLQDGGPMTIPRMMMTAKTVNDGLRAVGWCCTRFEDTTMENVHGDIIKAIGEGITGKKLRICF